MSFLTDAATVASALDEYHREAENREQPVVNQPPLAELVDRLDLAYYAENGGLADEALAQFIAKYLPATTRLHHPGYMAHQVAVTHYAGALGSLIDGFTNNAMAIYEMGPAAASIEYFVINWMLAKVGWKPAPYQAGRNVGEIHGGGVLTHGGSLANLTVLTAARSHVAPEVWDDGNPGDLAVLAPRDCHYSIARAAGILGIGQKALYELETDARGVIIPDRLPAAYARVCSEGKRIVALVANAASTAVGLYDPLHEIGTFCREESLWFHVDGAHGASALLSERYRELLRGVELADSLVWDTHKFLRTPTLCAAVLVRDAATLDRAFTQEASYLFHDKAQPGIDLIHRTVECTKAGLGLRFFLVLGALGERGLAEYVDSRVDLAADAYRYIHALPDFECAVEPQSNILCFRVKGLTDEAQLALRDALDASGHFYISTTLFAGKRYLRLSLMHPHTNMDDIRRLIAEVYQLVDNNG